MRVFRSKRDVRYLFKWTILPSAAFIMIGCT